ncbi:binding partner of ACD11 1-like isoform X3 [Mangifera indica]|uniref:binding partner of ACD11 1-like isoform X3 n=1 Tax=Mangifera indica TaxID=29780 RepID=UPI001CFC31C3|nr:binding partner of ACD11 1-like isoform X3 [Mangifera indica]
MYPGGFIAEVVGLSPKVTEKDVGDFFSYCGALEHVEIIRNGEDTCSAYVTFKDAYALETAVLLSGATIADQPICIIRWGTNEDESHPWGSPWNFEENSGSTQVTHMDRYASTPGEAITVAQEVVKTMLAKGYVLSKDALVKAKHLDETYGLSAKAAAKVVELGDRIGLNDKLSAGVKVAKSVDEKYHVVEITKTAATVTGNAAVTAATFTGRTAKAAGTAVVNSTYFAKGALWVSGVLERAAKAAADLGTHNTK